ncbi:hypothetical protein [Paenibacillus thalictri]|uniref:Uncharacterized protein n=1 Tax=Paenibacillus thalictri TaxID=2527873 RepID=A0A4Q9DWT7_9BACL|nr:hypothetical protein [Paenibacillus thalictri]TBL80876.1 hypothetical protein EYB31_06570 [Paenibacillus thalictri]
MLHSEFIIERKKALFSDKNNMNFPEKYHIQKNVLFPPAFFDRLNDATSPTEFKLLCIIHHHLYLFPDTIANFIDNKGLEIDIIDDLTQHLALITHVATKTNEQPIEESVAIPYVNQLMKFLINKEENEELDLKDHDPNNETRLHGDDISYLPREQKADAIIIDLTTYNSHLPPQALPLRAFIAIYQQLHNELKYSKGKRPSIEAYKNFGGNLTPERKLHNRYWGYFRNSLQMVPSSSWNLNLVLFEWEYNIVLASHINEATKELPNAFKLWSRKVLSLTALLPIVESRLFLIKYYTEHQISILEETNWSAPTLSVKKSNITDAMLKLASDWISMSLIIIPILEINTQRILADEDSTLLEELLDGETPRLILKDVEEIEETLHEIHHVQSLYRKHKLWDIQLIINEFLKANPDDNFTIDSQTIELVCNFVRDKYFRDFLT